MGPGGPLSFSRTVLLTELPLHDRIQSVPALSLPPASTQASDLVLSCPGPGEMEEEPIGCWPGGFPDRASGG